MKKYSDVAAEIRKARETLAEIEETPILNDETEKALADKCLEASLRLRKKGVLGHAKILFVVNSKRKGEDASLRTLNKFIILAINDLDKISHERINGLKPPLHDISFSFRRLDYLVTCLKSAWLDRGIFDESLLEPKNALNFLEDYYKHEAHEDVKPHYHSFIQRNKGLVVQQAG